MCLLFAMLVMVHLIFWCYVIIILMVLFLVEICSSLIGVFSECCYIFACLAGG